MERSDKLKRIGYFSATGLTALAFLAGGLSDLARAPAVVAGMSHLGYPGYFASILGAWKVLGALAIAAPRFPRLKEWAYAGIVFAASWALRPEKRRLAPTSQERAVLRGTIGEPLHAAAR